MKIFLLGAGASFGSDVVGTPPMGGTLFDALRAFNPAGWGQLPTDLASLFRSDFERGMAQLAEVNPHAMPILQRAMAAFFFEFKPRPSNLYVELGKRMRLRGWSGAVGTLNYERLLEMSLDTPASSRSLLRAPEQARSSFAYRTVVATCSVMVQGCHLRPFRSRARP